MARQASIRVVIDLEWLNTHAPDWVKAVQAAALRDAADDLYSDDGPGNPLSTQTWLRARADSLDGDVR